MSLLQPQVLGQSVYGRVRQVDTVSMEVPVVHTPVAERERGRVVGEDHVLFRTQRHEPGVHGVDRVRCIRSLQPRTDAGHRHCDRLRHGRVYHRGERVDYRRSRGRRRRITGIAAGNRVVAARIMKSTVTAGEIGASIKCINSINCSDYVPFGPRQTQNAKRKYIFEGHIQ